MEKAISSLMEKANQLRHSGELEKAVELYRQVVEVNPNFSWGYYYLVETLSNLGQYHEAILTLEKAVNLNPNSAIIHHQLGEFLQANNFLLDAIECYSKAIQINPDRTESYHKLKQAIWEANSILDNKLDDPVFLLEIASDLAAQGKYERAVFCWKTALEIKLQFNYCEQKSTNSSWLRAYDPSGFLSEMNQYQQFILNNYPDNYQKINKNATERKKILLFSDSLGLPRQNIPIQITYPFLVCKNLINNYDKYPPMLITKCIRHRTIFEVWDDLNNDENAVDYDLIIVHVGIVDCYPRIFLPEERALVSQLSNTNTQFSNLVLSFAHEQRRNIIQLHPNRVYVPFLRWKECLKSIIKIKKDTQNMIFVNIIQPSDREEYRSPGAIENVAKYNSVLEELVAQNKGVYLIDFNNLIIKNGGPSKLTIFDEIHINQEAHKILATALTERICEVIKPQ